MECYNHKNSVTALTFDFSVTVPHPVSGFLLPLLVNSPVKHPDVGTQNISSNQVISLLKFTCETATYADMSVCVCVCVNDE